MAGTRKKRKAGKKRKSGKRKKKNSLLSNAWFGLFFATTFSAALLYVGSVNGLFDQSLSALEEKIKRPAPITKTLHEQIKKTEERPQKNAPPVVAKIEKETRKNTYIDAPEPTAPPDSRMAGSDSLVAIIIDDLGIDIKAATRLLRLNRPIAFSVLPHMKHSRTIAKRAHDKGMVVMLHLPMEAKDISANPGPGALMAGMNDDAIMGELKRDLEAVPHIRGVNNHMGSLFTEKSEKLNPVLDEIARRSLFFVDSRTSQDTVAYKLALSKRIKSARRDIFLDNTINVEKISIQLIKLARKAQRRGVAIGIGHPHPETILALEKTLPEMERMGVRVVPVTTLLK